MSTDEMITAPASSAYRLAAGTYSGAAVLHVQGDLDAATAGDVRTELRRTIGEPAVLLDLTGLTSIDSIGVGVLLGVIRGIHEHGGVVAITSKDHPRGGIATVLRAAGVDRVAFLSESPTEALEWLSHPEISPLGRRPLPVRSGP